MQRTTRPRRFVVAMLATTALASGFVVLLTAGVAAPTTPAALHPGFRVTRRVHRTISSHTSGPRSQTVSPRTRLATTKGSWIPTHRRARSVRSGSCRPRHSTRLERLRTPRHRIGIGGGCLQSSCSVTDSTLIQAGTEQDVSASGQATYDAWYEIIPVPEIASTIAVHPGDVVRCSIGQTVPGVWTITLNDSTDGQGFTQTVPYPSDESTAEWIEETPTEIGTTGAALAALPNLTAVHFTQASVNGANAQLVPDQALQLIDSNGNPIATPSAPVAGNSFNDCAWALVCAAPDDRRSCREVVSTHPHPRSRVWMGVVGVAFPGVTP